MQRVGVTLLTTAAFLLVGSTAIAGDWRDLNGDGEANKADAQLILAVAGATAGSPDFIAAADLDGDGVLSLIDVGLFLEELAK